MQPTDGATASANPSWVVADMDALIHQCDAKLAEHDTELDRLASGIAALESQRAAVRSERQQVVVTRERALHVQKTLLAAARAGAALRSGQLDGDTEFKVVPDPDEEDGAESDADESADATQTAAAGPTAGGDHTATTGASKEFDASKLGPRGMEALQIIASLPDQEWTPRLLAVRLEGRDAEADVKAHNRARALLDSLAKKQLVVKRHQTDSRRCYFVAATSTEAA
ncbi:hypothetical protein O1L44_19660 [Streptomyces noursei]|uniref:hypothetical protein n=1 Tax=Streptomyces noursei TaxID=1971 RepID=UPI0022C85FD9|nr:hypothetical protein [Streptomyces noursei]